MSTYSIVIRSQDVDFTPIYCRDGSGYEDKYYWHCTSVKVAPPKASARFVDIPGRNGTLDYSSALGLSVSDREITMEFSSVNFDGISNYAERISTASMAREQMAMMNGKRVQIESRRRDGEIRLFPRHILIETCILGRAFVERLDWHGGCLEATVKVTAQPFMRSVAPENISFEVTYNASVRNFDFSVAYPAIINQYPAFEVDGSAFEAYRPFYFDSQSVSMVIGDYSGHPYIAVKGNGSTEQTLTLWNVNQGSHPILTLHPYSYFAY